jgi:hypothetical protein
MADAGETLGKREYGLSAQRRHKTVPKKRIPAPGAAVRGGREGAFYNYIFRNLPAVWNKSGFESVKKVFSPEKPKIPLAFYRPLC